MPLVNEFNGVSTLTSVEFVKVFKNFDVDGNGYIEKKELDNFITAICKSKGEGCAMKKKILETYDNDKDARISMEELANLLPTEDNFLRRFKSGAPLHVVDFMKVWYHYDEDRSGYLENEELNGFLRDLLEKRGGPEVTPKRIEDYSFAMLELFDKNKDGKIELSELRRIIPVEENFLSQYRDIKDDDIEEIFSHYDQDKNGYIEGAELNAVIRDLLCVNSDKEPNTKDVEEAQSFIVKMADTDADGRISKKEIKLLFT